MVRWPSLEAPSDPSYDCSLERMWLSMDHDTSTILFLSQFFKDQCSPIIFFQTDTIFPADMLFVQQGNMYRVTLPCWSNSQVSKVWWLQPWCIYSTVHAQYLHRPLAEQARHHLAHIWLAHANLSWPYIYFSYFIFFYFYLYWQCMYQGVTTPSSHKSKHMNARESWVLEYWCASQIVMQVPTHSIKHIKTQPLTEMDIKPHQRAL